MIHFYQKTLVALLILIVSLIASNNLFAQTVATRSGDETVAIVAEAESNQTDTICILPQDEVWFINARDSHCSPDGLSQIHVSQLVDGQWLPEDLSTLTGRHTTDKTKGTVIYVHGNRTDEAWAKSRGLQLYDRVFAPTSATRPSVRFVMVGWRSEADSKRPLKEFADKARRSVVIGQTLAQLLTQFEDRDMVLTGFSLGSQAIITALNTPAIEQAETADSSAYQVTLIAPALDGCYTCSLLNRHPETPAVSRARIFTNSADCALKISRLVARTNCPGSDVSITQLVANGHLPLNGIEIQDLACEVGKKHSVTGYVSVPEVQTVLNQMLNETVSPAKK